MFSRIKSFAGILVGLFAELPLRLLTAQTEPVRLRILTGNSSRYPGQGWPGSFIAGQRNR
jgi:hypothetical protein